MPELPEVETVRRGLRPAMEGARIARVEQRRADLRFPFPKALARKLTGHTVSSIARRAKYLLFHLENGLTLLAHLGMSGSFRVEQNGDSAAPGAFHHLKSAHRAHDHLVLHMASAASGESLVTFNDPRRFGFMDLFRTDEMAANRFLAGLGVEPTGNELSGETVSNLFAGKKTPLKSALLDQRLIAGLGNIYVCEALWRAGLSPLRQASSVSGTPEAARLASEIRAVIADAIAAGGSSLRDYKHTDGSLGYFQHSFSVYGREGEPCANPGCAGTVARMVQSGRSTFFCAACQV